MNGPTLVIRFRTKIILSLLVCMTIGVSACRSADTSSSASEIPVARTGPVEQTTEASQASPHAWENYQPSSIKNILDRVAEKALVKNLQDNDLYIETNPAYQFLSTIDVSYVGKCRDIPKVRLMMIQQWMGTFGVSSIEDVEEKYLFERECLFAEESTEYWLPIQNLLLPYVQDSFNAGDELKLFVLWMGASKINGSVDHIILINNIFVEKLPGN